MNEVSTIVSALAGPAGAIILLALVLFGVWKFLNRALDLLGTHLAGIDSKFDLATKAIEKLSETVRSLALDMETIARQNEVRKPSVRVVSARDKEEAQ